MHSAVPLDREAVLEQVDRIAASPAFRNADRLQRFLRFVALNALDGRHDALKESVIGVEVFDRRPGYDPKLEPIVRIQARRLRAKLDDYYRTSGAADAIHIEIPKGGYIPQFRVRPPDTATAAAAVPVPIGEYPSSGARHTLPRTLIPVAAALIIVAAAVAIVAYRTAHEDAPTSQLVPLTSYTGDEFCPAVSPDGRQIAFSRDHGGNTDIYVKLLGSSRPVRLTTAPGQDLSPAWSPDGSTIAFYRATREKGEMLTVPALGGPERTIAEIAPAWQAVASNTTRLPGPSWTPDGRALVFTDRQTSASAAIVRVSLDTGQKRQITTPGATAIDESPLVSPRGATLAFIRWQGAGVCDIYVQPLAGGDAVPLTSNHAAIYGLAWGPDGRSIIFSSTASDRDRALRLSRVWIRGRTIEPVYGAGQRVRQPSFAAGVLAFQEVFQNINLWKMDLGAPTSSASSKPLITSSRQTHSPSLSTAHASPTSRTRQPGTKSGRRTPTAAMPCRSRRPAAARAARAGRPTAARSPSTPRSTAVRDLHRRRHRRRAATADARSGQRHHAQVVARRTLYLLQLDADGTG